MVKDLEVRQSRASSTDPYIALIYVGWAIMIGQWLGSTRPIKRGLTPLF
jgi:phosphate/sulfate permease